MTFLSFKICNCTFLYYSKLEENTMETKEKYYTKGHLFLEVSGDVAKIGLTSYAISMLREITYLEFTCGLGDIAKGEQLAFLESIKIVQELVSPVAGRIVKFNDALFKDLVLLNKTPETLGWLCEIEVDGFAPEDYLTETEYMALCQ